MIETSTLEALLMLPAADRLALAEALWNSLASDPEAVPMPAWHLELLEQRLAADDADTSAAEDWGHVQRRIESGG